MIVLVEDERSYASRIQSLLEQNNLQCEVWHNYDDLNFRLAKSRPNLMLLDIQIGDDREAGLNALKIIKERYPQIRVIILSSHLSYIRRAFKLGAGGYLQKADVVLEIEYIREMMREVRSGNVAMTEEVKRALVQSFQPFDYDIVNAISDRDRQIIALSASDKNVPQIAEVLGLKPCSIETYMRNIRERFHCHTVQGVVARAFYYRILDVDDLSS